MLLKSNNFSPMIHPTTRIASSAVISGDVEIGPNCSVGHGAVVVAEGGPIRIGANCVIMDTAVIRGVPDQVMRLGDHVLVGPRACLVGCTVEDEVFIATGASVFNGAVLGRGSEVRINAVVHLRTALEAGATVPIGWVAVGAPARFLPASDHEGIWAIQKTLDFPKYVFNTTRPAPGDSMMQNLMPRYTKALLRMHAHDHVAS
ncbi:gamma carbonic anhydrase family protein [Variovorax sp. J2P1-59]|uniref:gamma carbonic anhydrase family protein n=1 Tax=Variovorax flavidus TaxID=3053501 RepID=UPI002575A451|nr:gamma carbonic anhydrase family protein [Variovorax sp. J2P1-59]MDM0078586.1 gamma carbonic anhydrase family protein [Variovorax sp. J2P1-59]